MNKNIQISQVTFADFQKLQILAGKITAVELLPNAKYTTHKLTIDFGGEVGKKISCARVIKYSTEQLLGKMVIGVVNFPPRQIGRTMSEVLTLGVPDESEECVLLSPDEEVELGVKIF